MKHGFHISFAAYVGAYLAFFQITLSSGIAPVEAQTVTAPTDPDEPGVKKAIKRANGAPRPTPSPKTHTGAESEHNSHPISLEDGQTSTVVMTKFDKWVVSCDSHSADPGARQCVARVNVVKGRDDPRSILFMSVVKNASSRRLVLQTPTSVQLKGGVQIVFGDNTARHLEYVSCEPALCTAEAPLDAELADELKSANTATARWLTQTLGEATVNFPLDGVRAAIAFLESH